jgi:tetratricopeptide (TPR) repeat protein
MTDQGRGELYRLIAEHFNVVELENLAHELGLDLDELGGQGRRAKTRELVGWAERRKRRWELLELLRKERPHADWPDPEAGRKGGREGVSPIFRVSFHRNPNFTGREALLAQVAENLAAGENTAVTQAIAGLGGVGKTQLALEFCYRQRNDYDLVAWLPANDGTALAASYVDLGQAVGVPVSAMKEQAIQVAATRAWLEETDWRWLLVFDNADTLDPVEVKGYLPPGGQGNALITSRNPNWGGVAKTLRVAVFTEEEGEDFLDERLGRDEPEAATLAEALAFLPLALEHAAAYMEATGGTAGDYLRLFETERRRLWARAKPPDAYQARITTTWEIAFERLRNENKAAIALLDLCSFLAPEDIPLWMLTEPAAKLPSPLAEVVVDPLALDEAIGALRRYSLLEREGDDLSVHRLVGAVVRDRMPAEKAETWNRKAEEIVLAAVMNRTDETGFIKPLPKLLTHMREVTERARMREDEQAATLCGWLGYYLEEVADYERARRYYETALSIRETALGSLHPDTATALNNLGGVLEAMGDYKEAQLYYERALAIRDKTLGPEHPVTANSLNNLGTLLQRMGDLEAARRHLEQALAIFEKVLGMEHSHTITSLNNLAYLLRAMGGYEQARPLFERALAIREKVLGSEHPNTATSLNNLGTLLQAMGKHEEARPYYERALNIREKTLGLDHPHTASSLNNLGTLLQAIGQMETAESHFNRALDVREQVLGPEHPDTAQSLNNLGTLLQALGQLETAESYFNRALDIRERVLGSEHPDTAQSLNDLGTLLRKMGQLAEARPYYERALAINEKALGPEHPAMATSLNNLGNLLRSMGDMAGARPYYERALAIFEESPGSNHPDTNLVRENLTSLEDKLQPR